MNKAGKAGKAGKYTKGATSGPLLGVLGCRTPRKPSHRGPGPPTVECGGLVGNRGRKRTFTALEKWLSGQPNNSEQQGRPGSSSTWGERKGNLVINVSNTKTTKTSSTKATMRHKVRISVKVSEIL